MIEDERLEEIFDRYVGLELLDQGRSSDLTATQMPGPNADHVHTAVVFAPRTRNTFASAGKSGYSGVSWAGPE